MYHYNNIHYHQVYPTHLTQPLRLPYDKLLALATYLRHNTSDSGFHHKWKVSSMPKIFVSYRRADTQERAHRIADWLILKYGRENVFIDVDTIGAGEDFKLKIEDSLHQTDVLLIIIGDKWVEILNERLGSPDLDLVRHEVTIGLERVQMVIPVLTRRDIDIRATYLPDDIKPMMRRNFRFARGEQDFHRDMQHLKDEIDERFPSEPDLPP